MTDQAFQPLTAEVQEFLNLWAAGFSQVLELVGGNPSTTKTTPVLEQAVREELKPEATAEEQPAAPTVRTRFLAGGLIRGELAFTAPDFQAVQLGQILMSEPLDPATPFDEGHRDAYAELLRQVAGAVATSVKAKFGGPVDFTYSGVEPSSWRAQTRAELGIVIQGGLEINLTVELEGTLVDSIAKQSAPVAQAAPSGPVQPGISPGSCPGRRCFHRFRHSGRAGIQSRSPARRGISRQHPLWTKRNAAERRSGITDRSSYRVRARGRRAGGAVGSRTSSGPRRSCRSGRKLRIADHGNS